LRLQLRERCHGWGVVQIDSSLDELFVSEQNAHSRHRGSVSGVGRLAVPDDRFSQALIHPAAAVLGQKGVPFHAGRISSLGGFAIPVCGFFLRLGCAAELGHRSAVA
jgi:hypothetical protein